MNASDVMVRDVVTVGPEEPVSKAVQLLVDHDISALPVVDSDRRVIGISICFIAKGSERRNIRRGGSRRSRHQACSHWIMRNRTDAGGRS
jgi:CBS-domain-containing membrane protein